VLKTHEKPLKDLTQKNINDSMKTINIKGKEYVPVVERVKEFHNLYKSGSIETEVVEFGTRVSVKATVTLETEDGSHRTFTGHSQAEYGKGIMGEVALEVAETSAVGRALGFAGIGIDTGIASADEMRKVKTVAGQTDDSDVPF